MARTARTDRGPRSSARNPPPPKELEAVLLTRDPQMLQIVKLLKRLAAAPSNVLLSGESGTGKDIAAHALHFWGPRAASPVVKVDLPSIPGALIESELFGYERGAFTGASATKTGKLEMAGSGTLYLDHIGELPPTLQAKLLRVVEDRRFERLGGHEPIPLEARIVASASADLVEATDRGLFRRDLFHRLGVFWIKLPPLRDRPQDIEPLAQLFLTQESGRMGRSTGPLRFAPDALDALRSYSWPGNVRELKGAVEHAALMNQAGIIDRSHLPAHVLDGAPLSWLGASQKRPTLLEVERLYIERILKDVGGNQTRAAAILGISRKSLWERRRRFDLE